MSTWRAIGLLAALAALLAIDGYLAIGLGQKSAGQTVPAGDGPLIVIGRREVISELRRQYEASKSLVDAQLGGPVEFVELESLPLTLEGAGGGLVIQRE